MHPLLEPTRPTLADAQAACRAYLASRWKRFGLAWRCLPEPLRQDLVALHAWHALVREATSCAADDEDLPHRLQELRHTVTTVYAHASDSAIATALQSAVGRHGLSAMRFNAPLDELSNAPHIRTFQTRGELLQHARRLALGEARLLARVLGRRAERDELLSESLALGLQLTEWTLHFHRDLERGRLHVAVEDLMHHGVDILSLLRVGTEDHSDTLAPVIAGQIRWARELLARGWPLCEELGPWRGRQLAFVLRWHAASLSALEARGHARGPAPTAGWLRLLACAVLSLSTRAAPRFD